MRNAGFYAQPATLQPESRSQQLPVALATRRLARAVVPGPLRRRAFRAYQRWQNFDPKRIGLWAAHVYEGTRPFICTRRYRGFVLYYSRGSSFIDRIRFGAVWEAEAANSIVAELSGHPDPIVVDAGANIGLMTLNVLAAVPAARVHAFECGIHQRTLLERTLAANRLQGRVTVYPEALGAQVGEMAFAVHDSEHSAYDGFIDTRRGGDATSTMVPVQTLDGWWRSLDCPQVHVVKIDTEGAELWILEGAQELLARCRPVVFLEIQRNNVKVYPHQPQDVLEWLGRHGYGLESQDGTEVTVEKLDGLLYWQENFVARPRTT
jgi:FkbM family methyltransferase